MKKAAIFDYDELVAFARNRNYASKYWLVRKAIVAFAYFGGHRNCELRQLKPECLKIRPDGIEVSFPRAKQRQEIKVKDDLKIEMIIYCFTFGLLAFQVPDPKAANRGAS